MKKSENHLSMVYQVFCIYTLNQTYLNIGTTVLFHIYDIYAINVNVIIVLCIYGIIMPLFMGMCGNNMLFQSTSTKKVCCCFTVRLTPSYLRLPCKTQYQYMFIIHNRSIYIKVPRY